MSFGIGSVLATPNFDGVPVPIEVSEIDMNRDYNIINAEGYYGEVDSFEHYAEIVKTLTKKILDELIPKPISFPNLSYYFHIKN
ncbi:hypothetical protein ASJ81_05845 [Methanosarcina spelaei]|uniref:Uncharacterized protein n=1 Tax=Methanosarcina spelaei TaxID=1036679 RepID=A0A2A2HTS4_9EURY|nr:hypothetical protein [Methanosarcina spelaei]PAV12792.1 hypothetical protein ASJ81_05845 [Methanosarcina spelaei]